MHEEYVSEKKMDISIIIPTFNRTSYLQTTLNSIISQNFSPGRYEIIIVDGGSSDTT
jgi:poly(ribitol-phosphate) beta-N-acetylglucosaminyltransferase